MIAVETISIIAIRKNNLFCMSFKYKKLINNKEKFFFL